MLDAIDSKHHDLLTMTLRLSVALSPAHLENDCFLALCLLLNSSVHFAILNIWSTDRCVVNSSHHKHVTYADLLPHLKWKQFNFD